MSSGFHPSGFVARRAGRNSTLNPQVELTLIRSLICGANSDARFDELDAQRREKGRREGGRMGEWEKGRAETVGHFSLTFSHSPFLPFFLSSPSSLVALFKDSHQVLAVRVSLHPSGKCSHLIGADVSHSISDLFEAGYHEALSVLESLNEV